MDKKVEEGLSIAKIGVSAIPYIGGVISEIIGYVKDKILEKRLNLIEDELKYQKTSFEEFRKNIENLNEHKYFFARNNLRYYFLNCIPEAEIELCRSIVKYIQNDDEELQEEICEIIQQLNIHDINFIDIVNAYKKSDIKNKYDTMKKNVEAAAKSGDKYQDRNFIYSDNTIFIEDLNVFIGIPKSSVVDMLNGEFRVNNQKTLDIFYFGKSIIKLQNLGIVQTDFITTLGTASVNNIDRIHITQLGQKLLKYFEASSDGENLMKKVKE